MRAFCCATVFVELDRHPRFDFSTLLTGGDGLDRSARWLAHAPHLDAPVPLQADQLKLLEAAAGSEGVEVASLIDQFGAELVEGLITSGLLLGNRPEHEAAEVRNRAARDIDWWPPALIAHASGMWSDIDVEARRQEGPASDVSESLALFGAPPTHEPRRNPEQAPISLSVRSRRDFDTLLSKRSTCRNFDGESMLGAAELSTMLFRVWAALGQSELAPGAVAVKKSSPAGGGLHCTEAYLLVQRAEGLQPGLYHYLALEHALEPLRMMEADEAATLAHRFVAGQHWFANVPVMVIMVYRFDRLFWKYRRHSKAWRVAHLDVGHLSQTMYLSAADLGLGAFVTAAINDRDIDAELELPPLREASIAIVGFGPRAAEKVNIELDDLVPTPASQR